MSTYEFTFLLKDEEELKNIKDLVASVEGKVQEEEAWGKKTLAYPVKKQMSAYFYNWRLDMTQSKMEELKKKLNFNEKLLRYLLLKIDEKDKSNLQIVREGKSEGLSERKRRSVSPTRDEGKP